jgi:AbrB family looped-hinge helix DNA binding protein
MTYTFTITSKGQVTIPKEFRDKLGLDETRKATMRLNDKHEIVLSRPKTLPEIKAILGKPTGKDPLTEREAMITPGLVQKHVKKSS